MRIHLEKSMVEAHNIINKYVHLMHQKIRNNEIYKTSVVGFIALYPLIVSRC